MALFTDATKLHLERLISLLLDTNTGRLSAVHEQTRSLICELVKAESGLSIDNLDWTGGGGDYISSIDDLLDELINQVEDGFAEVEHIERWKEGRFKLDLFDLHQKQENKHRLGYLFYLDDELVFWGKDYYSPDIYCVDAPSTVAGILTFLALCKGDTDKEYFDNYTPAQLEFSEQFGEELAMLAHELEQSESEDEKE